MRRSKGASLSLLLRRSHRARVQGLGLSVVYGVVRAHHGFVDVESARGTGLTFRLLFPVRDYDLVHHRGKAHDAGGNTRGTETILVIEGEEMLRKVPAATLHIDGYEVLAASNSKDALSLYADHMGRVALVLSDMGLPMQDGGDVFKTLREMNPKVQFLLTSGHLDLNLKAEMLRSGIRGFIQKPFRPEDLLKAVRQLLDEGGKQC